MQITVEEFKKVFVEKGGDQNAIMAALKISRATFFRAKREAFPPAVAVVAAAPAVVMVSPEVLAAVKAKSEPVLDGRAALKQAKAQAAPVVVDIPVAQAGTVPQALPPANDGAAIARGVDGGFNVGAVEGPVDLKVYIPKKDGDLADYVPRMVYFDKLMAYYEAARSVFMFGEAGVGKTSLARYLAAHLGLPFLSVSCDVLLGFGELLGQINITNGTSHFVEGLFLKFCEVPSVILIDEVTALDAAKSFKLHQALGSKEIFVKEADRGQGRTYRIHPKCFIILAGNPPHNGRYNGVNKANVALVDRPDAIMEIPELSDDELRGIIPAHEQKDNLIRYYHEAREVITNNNLRTTFSVRVAKRILGILSLEMGIAQALGDGFLNGVKLTAGETAYKALYDLANTVWDMTGKGTAEAKKA